MSDQSVFATQRSKWIFIGGIALLGACVLIGIATAITDDDEVDDVAAETPSATEQPTPTPEPDPTATQEPEQPMITDDHVDETVAFMLDESLVRDITITINDDDVIIAIQVNHATNDEHARNLLDSAVRYLASQVAWSHESIDSPSNEHLGGIWDHYALQVGAGPDANTFYARGAKHPSSPHISWD